MVTGRSELCVVPTSLELYGQYMRWDIVLLESKVVLMVPKDVLNRSELVLLQNSDVCCCCDILFKDYQFTHLMASSASPHYHRLHHVLLNLRQVVRNVPLTSCSSLSYTSIV